MDEHEATWGLEDGWEVRVMLQKIVRLTAERDALVAACIVEYRTNDSGVLEHVWEWQLAGRGGTEPTRERAVAALMHAAGLKAGGNTDGRA